ncbi:MAG: AraC family transcriptional regulator [Saprospiraceae bacterium]|nr:AraC family transcriptional regulator [Saprospiraceae bacterium]
MDPMLEKIPEYPGSSIAVKREQVPYMNYPWHYHPEYELIYVEKSYGIRLMGDHIGNFNDGDLVFISANVPHVWRNDKAFYRDDPNLMVDVYVIHFLEEHFHRLLSLVEAKAIRELFRKGQRGLSIYGETHQRISQMVKTIYHTRGFTRIVMLLDVLNILSLSDEYESLASAGFHAVNNKLDSERMTKIYDYVMTNFDRPIHLSEVAALVHLNKTSFCRYFKSRTSKSFSQFVNEIRIGQACKILMNTDYTVSQVASMAGYNNISHFNRKFREFMGMSALAFRRQHHLHAL